MKQLTHRLLDSENATRVTAWRMKATNASKLVKEVFKVTGFADILVIE